MSNNSLRSKYPVEVITAGVIHAEGTPLDQLGIPGLTEQELKSIVILQLKLLSFLNSHKDSQRVASSLATDERSKQLLLWMLKNPNNLPVLDEWINRVFRSYDNQAQKVRQKCISLLIADVKFDIDEAGLATTSDRPINAYPTYPWAGENETLTPYAAWAANRPPYC